ncbi:NADH-ubiquinone oxidoreductase-F iron-sulfur binding region domain-containing protein [Specibacter sp. RAF43]|uniref:NADH-ubiquinone oxidoreductase-F iron-sulfur binding region domain-containing protein n=1 Tax=Specibacter sp. RAF43 TaxID=3233057 RepID=UPI003F9617D3
MSTQIYAASGPGTGNHAPAAASRLFAAGAGARYADHAAAYGLPAWPGLGATFLPALQASGLTGRGGAGFASWRKLAGLAPGDGGARTGGPVLIANGAEGDPLGFKDATLLHNAAHLVIDGLLVAAAAVGARELYVYAGAANLEPVAAAVAERADAGAITLVPAPDAFIAGAAGAVVNFLETGKALPRDLPGRLVERGLRGRPTLLYNVETWAHMALIARYGADWFRSVGEAGDPGTRLVSLSGDVPAELVVEVPGGAPVADVLAAAGVRPDAVGAVLVGGYHGRWVRPEGIRLSAGAGDGPTVRPGLGVLHVLGRDRCGLCATAGMVNYLAGASARQCGPCMFGLPALAAAMSRLTAGGGGPELVGEVRRLGALVAGRGACHHPDGTVQLVHSALEVFAADVPGHLAGGCPQASGGWS